MKKYYSEPELEIRKYVIKEEVFTDSNPNGDLDDDDNNDYFK